MVLVHPINTSQIQGVDHTIHSKGPLVLKTMLELVDTDGPCFRVCEGVLVSLMHHTTPETFHPALAVVYDFVDKLLKTNATPQKVKMAGRLLYTVATVRKGCRIKDWHGTSAVTVTMLQIASELPVFAEADKEELKKAMWEVLKAAAMILQQADLEVAIRKCGKVVDMAKGFQDGALFLPFCDFFSTLGTERFRVFLLPYFQRFIVAQWANHEDALCLLIPKLAAVGSLTPPEGQEASAAADLMGPKSPLKLGAMKAIQEFCAVLEAQTCIDSSAPQLITAWQYLNVLSSLPFTETSFPEDIVERLGWLLRGVFSLPDASTLAPLAGKALSLYSRGKGSQIKTLAEPLCKSLPILGGNAVFLQGTVDFILLPEFKAVIGETWIDTAAEKLTINLASSSHEIRRLSLRCLELLHALRNTEHQLSACINTAQIIEDTPLTIVNARNVSMYVRRLGIEYAAVPDGAWERRIVPYYCFGLLTVHFSPAWDDAAAALAKVAEVEEELVAALAFEWLQIRTTGVETTEQTTTAPSPWTSFECTNMRAVEEQAEKCIKDCFEARSGLVARLGKVG